MKSLGRFPDRFLQEIAAQPEAIRRAAAGLADQAATLERLTELDVDGPLVFTGMGASYDACYAPVTALASCGVDASMVDAAELLYFRRPILRPGTTLVAVSQSGASAEVVHLLDALDAERRPAVAAVTSGTGSAVARAADVAIDTRAGPEAGPSTMSFVASLVVLAAIAEVLCGRGVNTAIEDVLGAAERTATGATALLRDPEGLAADLRRWLGSRRAMAIVGRGAGRAASEAGALVLKEAARLPAEGMGTAQFRHGPLELAGPDLAVAIVATEPATAALDAALAADLVAAGAAVAIVGETAEAVPSALSLVLDVPDRSLAPAAAVIPFQLLAWVLAVEQGLDPGMLAIATKVTTRE